MTLFEAQQLIRQGEGDLVEFKRKAKYPERIIKEVVAFANSSGGHLFIGVDDYGTIVGLKDVYEEHFVMEKAISELCRPKIRYDYEVIPISLKQSILHYYIYSGDAKPYFGLLTSMHKRGKAFFRIQDRCIQASRELRQILKFSSQGTPRAFSYGKNEKILFNYLGNHENITVEEYAVIANISRNEASQILINLTVSNALKIVPEDHIDHFVFVE